MHSGVSAYLYVCKSAKKYSLQDPDVLRHNLTEMSASLLGCGLDAEKCVLFQQSAAGGYHTELCWLLTCLSTVQQMQRMSTYKEKSSNMKEIPLGLYLYPLLQAADILLYKVSVVILRY